MFDVFTKAEKTSLEYLNSKNWLGINCQLENNQDTNITSILYDIMLKT